VTSVDRTAYPQFPRVVSGRELAEAFTPSDGEVDWARGRTKDAGHLLALVVWLKSYQRLGYFPKLAEVPGAVAGHVRGVLGLPDRVGLEQATERSAKRHRQFVGTGLRWSMNHLGYARSRSARSAGPCRRRTTRRT
jgi:Domain of unknown function (DUF4158)